MKKVIVIALVVLFIAAGSGYTLMQESFRSEGPTYYYVKDEAPGVGVEVLKIYNEGGFTTVDRAVAAQNTAWGPRMSITEKVHMDPGPQPADPYLFHGVAWGPDARVKVNQDIDFEGTSHHTVFGQTNRAGGQGAYAVEVQGDSPIDFLANKQFAPAYKPFLPVQKLESFSWPTEPGPPIDP